MPNYFAITAVVTSIQLDAERTGQASFTVTNATQASIGGDAVVVPQPGAEGLNFEVDHPSRHFDPGATEKFAVNVTAPAEVPKGTYSFVLRVLLGGGVPEEEYDDGPVVTCDVPEMAGPVIVNDKRRIPWWLIGLILLGVLLIGGAIAFFLSRGAGPSPSTSPAPTLSPAVSASPAAPIGSIIPGARSSEDVAIEITSITPSLSTELTAGQRVNILFTYNVSVAGGTRIFVRPMSGDQIAIGYTASGSGVYQGSGDAEAYFTMPATTAPVDRIRFEITNSDQTDVLEEFFVVVHYELVQ